MSQNNYKGLVQEKLAKFKGLGKAEFTTNQTGNVVMFESRLVATFQYNDETKQLSTQSDGRYPSKKEAEQSAAGTMLALEDFNRYCDYTTWTTAGNTAVAQAPQSLTNPKGILLEAISKMVRRPHVEFSTTPHAPFSCTVTISASGSAENAIEVTSGPCPSKKEAEQQASERMLNSTSFKGMSGNSVPPLVKSNTPYVSVSDPNDVSEASAATVSSLTSCAPYAGGSSTVASNTGNENYKGMLLEKMAKLGGGVKFESKQGIGGFSSTATAQHLKYATVFESRSAGECSSKKLADQSAAWVMLRDPAFDMWLRDGTAPTALSIGANLSSTDNHADLPLTTASALSSVMSTNTSSTSTLSSTGAPHLNPKGILYERAVKMLPQPLLTYITSPNEPFMCTLTAKIPSIGANSIDADTVITVQGGPSKTKKAAEQEAASIMLSYPQFLTLGSSSIANNNDSTVRCTKCNNTLGNLVDFCFYVKSETEVQFILKPEITKQLTGKSPAAPGAAPLPVITYASQLAEGIELSQRVSVHCGHCRACIGAHLSFGPDGAALTAFKNTDVRIKGAAFPSSRSWRVVATEEAFVDVEQRTPRNFYGVEETSLLRTECDLTPVVHPVMLEGLHTNSPDYEYSDLLDAGCGKVPREEQVTALHVCLQHHAIVVFPTGFGKTLVASMVMHRYRRLNPTKLVLMVEERVPLVEQQCKAVHTDTGMKLCPLYGENSTMRSIKQLLSGDFDAAVITAGALCNYLTQDILRITDFSVIVFDESHHATKNHAYKLIVDMILKYPVALQPRVVGLTASLLKEKTEEAARGELEAMRETFLDADVYRPNIGANIHDLLRHTVRLSPEQRTLQRRVVSELNPHIVKLSSHFAVHRPTLFMQLIGENNIHLTSTGDKYEWMRVTQLSAESYFTVGQDPQPIIELAATMREMVTALEHNYLLGPAFVTFYGNTIEETIRVDASPEPHPLKSGVSPQLRQLCDILATKGADSCTLVFVETRSMAAIVHAYIDAKFPHLCAERMVGQSGEDGMRWGGAEGQSAILKKFRSKECKLIVCTSVLEEGLDVKGCNLVIRLGGTPSLIRLVQSKGRARDEQGELRLILTTDEEEHLNRLLNQERMLDSVLEDFASLTLCP